MEKRRIHHLQHVPFEDLGIIKDWISMRDFIHTETHIYKNENLPNVDDIDWLIVLGGPMSVNDEEEIEWLKSEKRLIREAIQKNKTVIGICLGAQLIAEVLGAKVYRNAQKEIGWFPVQSTVIANAPLVISSIARNLATKFTELLNNQTVFHWHGETFDLPENTIRLVSSEACKNQAFLYKENVLGLQFHVEMNETSIHKIIENCREELIISDFVQSEETIKNEMEKYIEKNRKLLLEMLDTICLK